MAYKHAYEIHHLAVGKLLPNGWTVMAYAVSDRHAVVLCSITEHLDEAVNIDYATWDVSNNDLRSTAHGHYDLDMDASFADFKARVANMYQLS